MPQDFKASPSSQPDLTSGQLGEDAGVTHMRAFLSAMKRGDPDGMWTAFKAGASECSGQGYGEESENSVADAMMSKMG